MEVFKSINEQLLSETKPSVLLNKVEFKLNENEKNLNDNKTLKHYIFLKPDQLVNNGNQNGLPSSPVKQINKLNKINNSALQKIDGLPVPKQVICLPDAIQLDWKQVKEIGAGYINLGNTCFMNAVLQCLTYCPPLSNYLLFSDNDHLSKCKVISFCMTCELIKHMKNSYQNTGSVIRPYNIFQRLKSLAKHFQPGRQEDAHEFLRYVIDNIWKSCVINWEALNGKKLDNQSKETTFINQIFGGYHRSQITCFTCKAKSDTYDYFMDFILDIKNVASLEKALEKFIRPQVLQNENAYKCSNCNKKVPAQKKFTVHKAPNVATFQLKRFDYNWIFGGKITKQISYPESLNLRPFMSDNKGDPINYKLNSVLVHLGSTSNSGHYFCYVRNSNDNWYLMDDSRVSEVSLNHVLNQQAYILFYVRVPNKESILSFPIKQNANLSITNNSNNKLINGKMNGLTLRNCKLDENKKLNIPKIISENSPIKKNKSNVNNNNFNNVIQNDTLAKINEAVNKNLNSKKDLKVLVLAPTNKSIEATVKRLVPYENNSSEEDSNESDKKQKVFVENGLDVDKTNKNNNNQEKTNSYLVNGLTNILGDCIQSNNKDDKKQIINGFAKFAESIGNLFGDLNEEDLLKQVETMSTEKLPILDDCKKLNNSTNSEDKDNDKTDLKDNKNLNDIDGFEKNIKLIELNKKSLNKEISPLKSNGFLTHVRKTVTYKNIYPKNTTVRSTKPSWAVCESLNIQTPSIASESSSNSVSSTTEWHVTDKDSSKLKKHLLKKTVDSTWKIINENEPFSLNGDDNLNKIKNDDSKCSNSVDESLFEKHLKKRTKRSISDQDSDDEKKIHKKLKKSKKRHKKEYRSLNSEDEQLIFSYKKLKKKKKKSYHLDSDSETERLNEYKSKKHKKKHKKDRKHKVHRHSLDYSSNDEICQVSSLNKNLDNKYEDKNNSSICSNFKIVKNGLSHDHEEFKSVSNGSNKNVTEQLNEMHLALLGKNVNTWDGKKTELDCEIKKDLLNDKKKSKDDIYNEDYDKGKIKKNKQKKDFTRHHDRSLNENYFQKFYNNQYLKN